MYCQFKLKLKGTTWWLITIYFNWERTRKIGLKNENCEVLAN